VQKENAKLCKVFQQLQNGIDQQISVLSVNINHQFICYTLTWHLFKQFMNLQEVCNRKTLDSIQHVEERNVERSLRNIFRKTWEKLRKA